MSNALRRSCALIGALFLVLGLITLLGIIMRAHLTGEVSGLFVLYTALNFLMAYGFFERHYWVYPALVATLILNILLWGLRIAGGTLTQTDWLVAMLVLILNLALIAITHRNYRRLARTRQAQYVGVCFLVLWALMACYTILIKLV